MDTTALIKKYYAEGSDIYNMLVKHSADVTRKALSIVKEHPELHADAIFVEEAAMLHDIGIYLTHAPAIHCFGEYPYLCHGYLGAEILQKEGLPRHALVCERHTGTGISLEEIIREKLPLPHRDMRPQSMEEQLICFADCFFSKTRLGEEKTPEQARKKLLPFGEESVRQFDKWCEMFL
ncbi:HDIG domain-containing metalloprotein [Dysgonomonas sp. 25]|uniref:HDIG domain-containing metalloprotein n=1 Tax=Dysgonomonas sp. 25 TaxID=2302933 RepID=UPI0013D0C621